MPILSRPRTVITLRPPLRFHSLPGCDAFPGVGTDPDRQRGWLIIQLEDGAGEAGEGTGR